jgi:hypothetical protein
MSSLLSYRPWNFRDGDASQITALTEPERKSDDRSPFVQYARSAALWAEWVREEVVGLDPEIQLPSVEIDGHSFRYALVPIDSLVPLVSVPPSARVHQQRLLEATQLYSEPIVVIELEDGTYSVVGNHELFSAAKAYQQELARPNKQRPSDVCLVAVADESYLSTIRAKPLSFGSTRPLEDLRQMLAEAGYADSPRTDDPHQAILQVAGENYLCPFPGSGDELEKLREILGVRSLDSSSDLPQTGAANGNPIVTLSPPKLTKIVLNSRFEFPYLAYTNSILPLPGANMWSLRDFRI